MQQLTAALVSHVSTTSSVQSHETPKRRHEEASLSEQAQAASNKVRRLNNVAELTSIATCQHAISHPSPFRADESTPMIRPPPTTQRVHERVQALNQDPNEFDPVSEEFIQAAAKIADESEIQQATATNTVDLISPTQLPALATQDVEQATPIAGPRDESVFQGEIFSPVTPTFLPLNSPVSLRTRSNPRALDSSSSKKNQRAGSI